MPDRTTDKMIGSKLAKDMATSESEEKATQPPTKCITNGGVQCKFVV
jgi:hypothetical protein